MSRRIFWIAVYFLMNCRTEQKQFLCYGQKQYFKFVLKFVPMRYIYLYKKHRQNHCGLFYIPDVTFIYLMLIKNVCFHDCYKCYRQVTKNSFMKSLM